MATGLGLPHLPKVILREIVLQVFHQSGNADGSANVLAGSLPAVRTHTVLVCALALLVLSVSGADAVFAAITPTGFVRPVYDGTEPWVAGDELHVGYFRAETGTLVIDNGSRVSSLGASIAGINDARGTVTVRGAYSLWQVLGDLSVGEFGRGELNIEDGGTVRNNRGDIGQFTFSTGVATVTGPGSTWQNAGRLNVGYQTEGRLNIRDGGVVTAGYATIGTGGSVVSSVYVQGEGAAWIIDDRLDIGANSKGSLYILSGGTVRTEAAYLGVFADKHGEATITGPGSRWDNAERFHVGYYHGAGTLNIRGGGTVSTAGMTLGSYTADSAGVVNLAGGTLDLNGDDLKRGPGSAQFNFTAGRLTNVGTINLMQQFQQLGGTLAPGASIGRTDILGDYALTIGTLEIELGGIGNPHDLLSVTGDINISQYGTILDLSVLGRMGAGFYKIMESRDGTINGRFNRVTGLDVQDGVSGIYYFDTEVILVLAQDIVPEPGTISILALSAMWNGVRRRTRGRKAMYW